MGPKKKASKEKKNRKIFSIEQKKEIITKHNEGVKVMQLSRIYNTSHSTISTILAKKEELMVSKVAKGTSRLNVRSLIFEEMENLLLIWIREREIAGNTTSQNAICQKAKQIYQDLKNKTPGSSSDVDNVDFKGSRGWFDNFKKRTGINSVVRNGEAASADKKPTNDIANSVTKIIEDEEYLPHQIFNDTGLYWKKMSNRAFVSKEETTLSGHKPINDRLTLLLERNARKEQDEIKEMAVTFEVEDGEKEQITTSEIKDVLAMWEEVQNVAIKWNPNKSEVIRTADLFNEKSMHFFRNILKKRHCQKTQT